MLGYVASMANSSRSIPYRLPLLIKIDIGRQALESIAPGLQVFERLRVSPLADISVVDNADVRATESRRIALRFVSACARQELHVVGKTEAVTAELDREKSFKIRSRHWLGPSLFIGSLVLVDQVDRSQEVVEERVGAAGIEEGIDTESLVAVGVGSIECVHGVVARRVRLRIGSRYISQPTY
jgi:hypothetical protein